MNNIFNIFSLMGPVQIKKIIARYYLNPSNKSSEESTGLDEEWASYLDKLTNSGYVVIPRDSLNVERILSEFEHFMKMNSLSELIDDTRVIDYGVEIPFTCNNLMDLFANPNLVDLMYEYYGRQFYYTGYPNLMSHSYSSKGRSSEIPHIDGYRQLTLYLMITEMSGATSQLYVKPSDSSIPGYDLKRIVRENSGRFLPVEAKKGDLVIFNSGSVWHHGLSRVKQRVIVTTTVTTGWLKSTSKAIDQSCLIQYLMKDKSSRIKGAFKNFS